MAVLKHIPERTCIVCRRKSKKESFFRLLMGENSMLIQDAQAQPQGRGFYVCKTDSCITQLHMKIDSHKKHTRHAYIDQQTATVLQKQLPKS